MRSTCSPRSVISPDIEGMCGRLEVMTGVLKAVASSEGAPNLSAIGA
jgi:hypothetical protein